MTVSHKPQRRTRRAVPRSPILSAWGERDYFTSVHSSELSATIGKKLCVPTEVLAAHLNDLTNKFLKRYSLSHSPSPDSKAAEWCETIARVANVLLETLGCPDSGFHERQMPINARVCLTNNGADDDWIKIHVPSMRLGETIYDVLDRVPAATFTLKRIAEAAAQEYRLRASSGRSKLNARQPQHVFLLEVMALIYQKAFGLLPTKQPNATGPFFKAVNFVRLHMIARMNAELDCSNESKKAARRLRAFTPTAAARLWVRERKQIAEDLNLLRNDSDTDG